MTPAADLAMPSTAAITAVLHRQAVRSADARIRDYVVLLVERLTRDDLRPRRRVAVTPGHTS